MCRQKLSVLLMNNSPISSFPEQSSPMSLFFRNYSPVEVTYLLLRFNKFFPWNTKKTDRNGLNKQDTHFHTTHSEKDSIGLVNKGLVILTIIDSPDLAGCWLWGESSASKRFSRHRLLVLISVTKCCITQE